MYQALVFFSKKEEERDLSTLGVKPQEIPFRQHSCFRLRQPSFHWIISDEVVTESEELETFWFFRLRFRRAYDYAYDSDFRFSLGHKLSYDSDYDSDSDSVASENQLLGVDKRQLANTVGRLTRQKRTWKFCAFSTYGRLGFSTQQTVPIVFFLEIFLCRKVALIFSWEAVVFGWCSLFPVTIEAGYTYNKLNIWPIRFKFGHQKDLWETFTLTA